VVMHHVAYMPSQRLQRLDEMARMQRDLGESNHVMARERHRTAEGKSLKRRPDFWISENE
jgi:hypothetical protein